MSGVIDLTVPEVVDLVSDDEDTPPTSIKRAVGVVDTDVADEMDEDAIYQRTLVNLRAPNAARNLVHRLSKLVDMASAKVDRVRVELQTLKGQPQSGWAKAVRIQLHINKLKLRRIQDEGARYQKIKTWGRELRSFGGAIDKAREVGLWRDREVILEKIRRELYALRVQQAFFLKCS